MGRFLCYIDLFKNKIFLYKISEIKDLIFSLTIKVLP